VTTEYRGVLATRNGEELRWLINRERMRDTVTGETFTRAIMRSTWATGVSGRMPWPRLKT